MTYSVDHTVALIRLAHEASFDHFLQILELDVQISGLLHELNDQIHDPPAPPHVQTEIKEKLERTFATIARLPLQTDAHIPKSLLTWYSTRYAYYPNVTAFNP